MKQWTVNKMFNNLYLVKCKHVDDWKSKYRDIMFFVWYEFLYMMQILSTYTILVSRENMKEKSILLQPHFTEIYHTIYDNILSGQWMASPEIVFTTNFIAWQALFAVDSWHSHIKPWFVGKLFTGSGHQGVVNEHINSLRLSDAYMHY